MTCGQRKRDLFSFDMIPHTLHFLLWFSGLRRTQAQERRVGVCAHSFPTLFSDLTLAAWNWPWWEHLYHSNGPSLKSGSYFPETLFNIYQHNPTYPASTITLKCLVNESGDKASGHNLPVLEVGMTKREECGQVHSATSFFNQDQTHWGSEEAMPCNGWPPNILP